MEQNGADHKFLCKIISLCAQTLDKSCRDFDTSNDQTISEKVGIIVL